jgi:hypothetical protein
MHKTVSSCLGYNLLTPCGPFFTLSVEWDDSDGAEISHDKRRIKSNRFHDIFIDAASLESEEKYKLHIVVLRD